MTEERTREEGKGITFGSRLKALREARGISRGELARRVGVTVAQISNLEKDRANPSAETLVRILQALQASLEELVPTPEVLKERKRSRLGKRRAKGEALATKEEERRVER